MVLMNISSMNLDSKKRELCHYFMNLVFYFRDPNVIVRGEDFDS